MTELEGIGSHLKIRLKKTENPPHINMTILDFDEIEKYQEVREWFLNQTPSQLMQNKKRAVDTVWDLLEYLYILGYERASEEIGEYTKPKDYQDVIYKKFDGKDFEDRVSEYAELGDAGKILRVVETDGNRVYNEGGLGAAKGKAKTKTWKTMNDEKVRSSHEPLENITVPVEDDFYTYDGDHAPGPCGFENPANNVNCRCWLEFQREL